MSSEQFRQRMSEFTVRYRGQMHQTIELIEAALAGIVHAPLVGDALHAIERQAHTLAGSAPTFGFRDIGMEAARLEEFVRPLRLRGTSLATEEAATLRNLVMGLKAHASYA